MWTLEQNSLLIVSTIHIITTIFLIYEFIQFYANKTYYIADFWNYFDFSGFLIIFIYCFEQKLDIESETRKLIFAFGAFVLFLRGISYLRAFDMTRYMVGMVIEIVKDMSSFFIILMYGIYALGCINFILSSTSENKSFGDYISNMFVFYRVSMGDWEVDDYQGAGLLVVFILSTLIFPLVLMNLLIALMGDTYSKVQEKLNLMDYQLKAQLLWELESAFLHKRESGTEQYLLVYQKKEIENQDNSIEGLLYDLKRQQQLIIRNIQKQQKF